MSNSKIKNMEEFAEHSGVSRPTVSKYFNDPESVKPSTRSRIEQALERFDYQPNIYAINQNRRLTKTIGIVVPYLADPFFAEIARKIEAHCIQAGYSPYLFSSHGKQELENNILHTLRSMKPAGVLLAPLGRASDHSVVERFCKDVPTVLFDSNIERAGSAFIGSNNPQFTFMMVDYLCRTGEPPCFFEIKTPPNPNANKRHKAYIQAMQTLGHEPKFLQIEGNGWNFEDFGYQAGKKLIDQKSLQATTILCSNDRLAIGLILAAYEAGKRIGHAKDCDLRIAGQDDHPFSKYTCPPLTTVAQDYESISEKSVETLFKLIEGEHDNKQRKELLFEGRLIMRASA